MVKLVWWRNRYWWPRQYFEFIESKLDNWILSKGNYRKRCNLPGLIDIKEDEKHIYAYDEQETNIVF